jgi:hypothetical protein
MVYFCDRCKKIHNENDLCPHIKNEIKANPYILSEAANFASVAGQYHLVTSQSLDVVAQKVNGVIGSNLSFEGAHQFTRDIQVFNRLNVEPFSKCGAFNSPETAKTYLENATKGQLTNLRAKIVGSGQEVDWLRVKQGEIRSVVEKSTLLTKNAPGVDGDIVNRFTGEQITRVTVKGASTQGGLKTGTDGIIKALKTGTLAPDETAFVTEGMKDRLLHDLDRSISHYTEIGDTKTAEILTKAKDNMKIIERGSVEGTHDARERILEKISEGKANTTVTANEALHKAAQGAVIGAAIGLTISSLTNFIRYRKGNLSIQEAFTNIGEDTTKSTLIGGSMGVITLFLPGGAVGFVGGFAIGIYLNSALTNILDEVFGKGAYFEILTAGGYIMGTSMNLSDAMKAFGEDREVVRGSFERIEKSQHRVASDIKKTNKKLEVL